MSMNKNGKSIGRSISIILFCLIFGWLPFIGGIILLNRSNAFALPLLIVGAIFGIIIPYYIIKDRIETKEKNKKIQEEARYRQQSEKIDTVGAKTMFEIWDNDTQKIVCKKTKDGKLFYCDIGGNGSYINSYYGKPEFRIIETGVTEYTYHPSQYYYVGATVGSVTTGGIYKTKDSYSSKNIEAESGFICCEYKGPHGKQTASALKFVLNDELAKKAAETDVVKDYLQSTNILKVVNRDQSVSRDLNNLMAFSISNGADASTTLSIKSRAEAAMFAPLSDCRYCLDFINKALS